MFEKNSASIKWLKKQGGKRGGTCRWLGWKGLKSHRIVLIITKCVGYFLSKFLFVETVISIYVSCQLYFRGYINSNCS